ncbi:MAG TPA: RNA polymerase factor sigma-54 [Pyrinomonadaceae bacterium]|jgi:RNA polymerase sigma-54 factor|nr:RNA polymerase factor sigma-54 [Pyrinomonadaceae bacterium]
MSLKLTTSLSQRLVLTPQLRQRIEMLQMTTLELTDLIQQQILENPVLEEVATQEEVGELAEKILDHLASADPGAAADEPQRIEAAEPELGSPSSNGSADSDAATSVYEGEAEGGEAGDYEGHEAAAEHLSEDSVGDEMVGDEASRDAFEEIDFGREFQDYLDPGYKTQEIEYKESDAPTFEQFLTRAPSLADHLEWQLHMSPIAQDICEAAISVIGNLDADGRLNATNEEIAAMGHWSVETVEVARQAVMKLDPIGCGARDVRECLLIQLDVKGESARLAAKLISEHLPELQQHKLPHLAKQIGSDVDTLLNELQFIRTLDPYPGRRYSSEEPILISPEIYIEKLDEADDQYIIYFADDGSPRLRVSHQYQQMLGKTDVSNETKSFIREKMRSAVDLLRNIEHRRQTIYKVVESIVHRQQDFLDKGVQYIKPMMLKDIAEDIGMHLSTVSRVVNRKYAHTPQGVIELRRFFTEGMMNEDGEEISTRIIKLKIKKLIEEEDSHNPITDDQVVKILIKDGIKLSRRTVAKYRDQMSIPGSRERRAVV